MCFRGQVHKQLNFSKFLLIALLKRIWNLRAEFQTPKFCCVGETAMNESVSEPVVFGFYRYRFDINYYCTHTKTLVFIKQTTSMSCQLSYYSSLSLISISLSECKWSPKSKTKLPTTCIYANKSDNNIESRLRICTQSVVALKQHNLAEIWRTTTQFSRYTTVIAHAARASTLSNHCADADVATVARNELT